MAADDTMAEADTGASGAIPAEAATFAALPREHPWRQRLKAELHARPPMPVTPPARLIHVAFVTGEATAAEERAHLAAKCRARELRAPGSDTNHFYVEFWEDGAPFGLTWERHTEFSTYTFRLGGGFTEPFVAPALARVAASWLSGASGEILVAAELAFIPRELPWLKAGDLQRIFGARRVAGGAVAEGRAAIATDFAVGEQGRVCLLAHDRGLSGGEAARLVQRLLEIETYRMMALLALPLAREVVPQISRMEGRLAEHSTALGAVQDIDGEQLLLNRLSALAAEVETLAARTLYRFGAARAYYALVNRRLEELGEARSEGMVTLSEFLNRRLSPAMRTCESVHQRLENLSARVARTGDLLRTRVELALQQQNLDVLASMNQRAQTQLRLQQTVEGLSVVAITYYALGIIAYVAAGAAEIGLPVPKDLTVGLLVPVVAGLAWFAVRRVMRWLGRDRW
jgi:uncharacterized membrane-anchored protein